MRHAYEKKLGRRKAGTYGRTAKKLKRVANRATRKAAKLALATAIATSSASANEYAHYATVKGWIIGVAMEKRECIASAEFKDGSVLLFGSLNGEDYIAVSNKAWQSLKQGKRYELFYTFAGRNTGWPAPAVANGTTLITYSDKTAFWQSFVQAKGMSVYYKDEVIASFNLHGSYAAAMKLLECQDAMQGRNANGSTDPFADPFR